jgi:hypothetical protein
MASLRYYTSLLCQHPGWAISEAAARLRLPLAPTHGIVRGRVGAVTFDFDFGLDKAVRRMFVGGYETAIVALQRKLHRRDGRVYRHLVPVGSTAVTGEA